MNKFADKLYDKIIELSISKAIVVFVLVTGISTTAILKFSKSILGHAYTFTLSQIIAFIISVIFLFLTIIFIRKKLKSKQKFQEGTRVILSTKTFPVMSAGKYDFLKNKVQCSWSHDKEIKQQWINQNQLIEYEPPEKRPITKSRSDFWDRHRI